VKLALPSPEQTKDALAKVVTRVHSEVYRRTGGKFAGKVGKTQFLLLTTTGRRSGQPRTTPLNYQEDGDKFVVVASYGGDDRDPQWLHNLRADPAASVQIGARRHAVQGRVATAEEKARYWPQMAEMYPGYDKYQARTSREIPVVVLTRS
jgi:deazaflavin-dependent oxidoreductase (nitroreductase family)